MLRRGLVEGGGGERRELWLELPAAGPAGPPLPTCTSLLPTAVSTAAIHEPVSSLRSASTLSRLRSLNSACSSATVASKTASLRATSSTFSPWRSSRRASSLPMPLDEPVTSAHSAPYFFFRSCEPSSVGTSVFSTRYMTGESSSTASTIIVTTQPPCAGAGASGAAAAAAAAAASQKSLSGPSWSAQVVMVG